MARTAAKLPAGNRIIDFSGLGVMAKTFPIAKVRDVLAITGKASVRKRDFLDHVMVYYVIVMTLFMNASCRGVPCCFLEGILRVTDGAFAIRGLMHEAALRADEDPDRLSFLHAVRAIRRKVPAFLVIPPSEQACAA